MRTRMNTTAESGTPEPSAEIRLTPGLLALVLLVGVLAGLGAVVFTRLIALVHNLSFYGSFSWHWSSTHFGPPSPWGWGIVLVPALGAFVISRAIGPSEPAATGGGVTEVLEEIFCHRFRIHPRLAFWRPLATAVTLGTGGSAGDEGPAMQFGAALAAALCCGGTEMSRQRALLMACGSGAGIAAMFHAPVGAWLLVLELLLWPLRLRTALLTLLAVSAGSWCATAIGGGALLLASPLAPITTGWSWIVLALVIGTVGGLTSLLLIHSVNRVERISQIRIPRPWHRQVLAMLLLGVILVTTYHWSGHYYLVAGSYAGTSALLQGQLQSLVLIGVLLVLKIAATALTLGSGGSGGIFSPALFVGAALGALLAGMLQRLDPASDFALVTILCAMAAVVAATTGGILSAAFMVAEMTGNLGILPVLTLAAAFAFLMRRMLLAQSYFTLPLERRQQGIPENGYIRCLTGYPRTRR